MRILQIVKAKLVEDERKMPTYRHLVGNIDPSRVEWIYVSAIFDPEKVGQCYGYTCSTRGLQGLYELEWTNESTHS